MKMEKDRSMVFMVFGYQIRRRRWLIQYDTLGPVVKEPCQKQFLGLSARQGDAAGIDLTVQGSMYPRWKDHH